MLFSRPTSLPLYEVTRRYLPAASAAGSSSAPGGLSGTSYHLPAAGGGFNARRLSDERLPGLSLHRYHKVLKHLRGGIAPQPHCLAEGWLFSRWLTGETWTGPLPGDALAGLLYRLHAHPCFGWPVQIAPLLRYYWQNSDPRRRTPYWLRLLRRLLARKEPRPLRLAPLHMDVHAGNLIRQPQGLALIDWEYAGDGDIALELATILASNPQINGDLVERYAHLAHLEPACLRRQIARWRPWVALLVASWCEHRWLHTHQSSFASLADSAWQDMKHQEKIWVR